MVKPNVQKLVDLRGKTVGISTFGSQAYLTTVTLFQRSGMEPGKDVNLLPAGDNGARLAAMDAGKIDAAILSSPFDIFGAKRGYKVLLWSRDHVPLTQNVIVVTDKKLKQSPEQVKRTIKGTIEALKFIKDFFFFFFLKKKKKKKKKKSRPGCDISRPVKKEIPFVRWRMMCFNKHKLNNPPHVPANLSFIIKSLILPPACSAGLYPAVGGSQLPTSLWKAANTDQPWPSTFISDDGRQSYLNAHAQRALHHY